MILYLAPTAVAKVNGSISPVGNLKSLDSVHPVLYQQIDLKKQLRAAALIPRALISYIVGKIRT